jgi:periplasmic divalent cation tolerance protein
VQLRDASDVVMVITTMPDETSATALARALVDEHLAACVNIVPGVRSIYRWQGAIADEAEQLCVIKTARARLEAMSARVRDLHPYEVPELLVLSPGEGARAYCDWVLESTRRDS